MEQEDAATLSLTDRSEGDPGVGDVDDDLRMDGSRSTFRSEEDDDDNREMTGGNDTVVMETEDQSRERHDDGDSDLATDRIGVSALEDLFTERTDTGDDDDDDDGGGDQPVSPPTDDSTDTAMENEAPIENVKAPVARVASTFTPLESSIATIEAHSSQESSYSRGSSRAVSPLEGGAPPLPKSPSRPMVPARPPRVGAPPPSTPTQAVSYYNSNNNNSSSTPSTASPSAAAAPPLQLVSFDVGGRLFRCKAALIRKFPTKRLFHVMTCGCEQIDSNTFFIDRNPQHFEIILDWYRTGKPVGGGNRTMPLHVNEDALKEDAKYFDLYEELFPTPPLVPMRTKSPQMNTTSDATTLPKLPERPSRQPVQSPPPPGAPGEQLQPKNDTKRRSTTELSRFAKSEIHSVPTATGSAIPVWFVVRSHEHLIVESVRGVGKLLVRVTDQTGMARVLVDQAVLFDSRSWFYLQDDGRAKLQNCVLPGGHVYTFWTETILDPSPQPISPLPPPAHTTSTSSSSTTRAKAKGGASATKATSAAVEPAKFPALEVEFKLIATFSHADEMEENGSTLATLLQAKGKGWSESNAPTSPTNAVSSGGHRECLFLPPRPVPARQASTMEANGDNDDDTQLRLQERDAIAEQILAVAAKERAQKATVSAPQETKSSASTTLKRNGAVIAQPQQQQQPPKSKVSASSGFEKVTVYQPMEPPSPRAPSHLQTTSTTTSQYATQQPRQFRKK